MALRDQSRVCVQDKRRWRDFATFAMLFKQQKFESSVANDQ